jgi:hypothetical protein
VREACKALGNLKEIPYRKPVPKWIILKRISKKCGVKLERYLKGISKQYIHRKLYPK